MKRCPHCGKEVPEEAKVCGYCGNWFETEQAVNKQTAKTKLKGKSGCLIGAFVLVIVLLILALAIAVLGMMGIINFPFQLFASPTASPIALPTSASPTFPKPTSEEDLPPTQERAPTQESTQDLPTPAMEQPVFTETPIGYIFDPFDNPDSGFPIFPGGDVGYTENAFRIAFDQPGGFHAAWSPKEYADATVELFMSVPEAYPGTAGGLTLRTTEKGWYLFWLYPSSQEYQFVRDIGRNPVDLIPRTYSSDIRSLPAKGDWLHLQIKVEMEADQFRFWVSTPGEEYILLNSIRDDIQLSGHLGPAAKPPDQDYSGQVEVFFDWISILPK